MLVDTFNRKLSAPPRPRTSSTDDQAPTVRAVIADRSAAWDALLRLRVANDRQARAAARTALRAAAHALAPSIRDDPGGVRGFVVVTLLARRRPAGLHPRRRWSRAVLTSAICAADRRDDDAGLRAAVASLSTMQRASNGLVRDVLRHESSMRRGLDRLLAENLSLVRADVSRFLGPRRDVMGLERVDLEQEGALGLLHALRSFDPDRGFAVSTFALPWIKQAVRRAVADKAAVVRAPVGLVEAMSKINAVRRAHVGDGELSVDELAALSGKTKSRVRAVLEHYPVTASASAQALSRGGDIGGLSLLDRLEDPNSWDAVEVIAREQMRDIVQREVARLSPREAEVLRARYLSGGGAATNDDGVVTFESIGRVMGVSRERVRQIEVAAMRVIRRRLGASGRRTGEQTEFATGGAS